MQPEHISISYFPSKRVSIEGCVSQAFTTLDDESRAKIFRKFMTTGIWIMRKKLRPVGELISCEIASDGAVELHMRFAQRDPVGNIRRSNHRSTSIEKARFEVCNHKIAHPFIKAVSVNMLAENEADTDLSALTFHPFEIKTGKVYY